MTLAVHATGSQQGHSPDEQIAWSLPTPFDGYVGRCVGYAHRFGGPRVQQEQLSTDVVLILGLSSKLAVVGRDSAASSPTWLGSFVGGLDDRCALVAHDGAMRGIQVDLSPLAAWMAFKVPMCTLARQAVDLEDLLGHKARLLEERLSEAPTWEARFQLVQAELARKLAQAEQPPADVSWAWLQMVAARGCIRVGDLAGEIGCSRKHLAARFREHVGLAPKLCARMLRVRHASRLVAGSNGRDLAEIAARCGYYDQAHLDRDFRDLMGVSPSAYRHKRVTSVQDTLADPI